MTSAHQILRDYRVKQSLSPSEFANLLGIPEPTLRSLENGNRAITPERAKEIEERTQGALTRAQLRPDIFDQPAKARKAAA